MHQITAYANLSGFHSASHYKHGINGYENIPGNSVAWEQNYSHMSQNLNLNSC